MEAFIHIKELAPSMVTRPRGEEAYQKLQERQQLGPVEIDLTDATLLSASFLDGFVLRLIEAKRLDVMTFVTADPGVQRKLAKVAGLHDVTMFFRTQRSAPRQRVQPAVARKIELSVHPLPSQA